ncbi:hypothetical protein [Saccharothrix violaceirubra]|uniref:Uncharacterized protein n=1 Tax=Saccharothrix violaceirubra TaxID=413306 RepID=A0A7W7WZG3_9PSEU|nr:hypothetical protein [Saccharothrix violaceirubra]MBB4969272.1 hypothetical protein [Saccharothrix violaceirubra]
MDEVEAMTRAGESVGKAVRAVRRRAVQAGHAGADAAVHLAERGQGKLAERGVTADHLRGIVADKAGLLVEKAEAAEKSTRRTRRQLAKKAKAVRKDLLRTAERARKDAKVRTKEIRKAAKQARKDYAKSRHPKGRRWPWVVGILTAGVVAAYVALSRKPEEVLLEDDAFLEDEAFPEPRGRHTDDATLREQAHSARNGQISDH